MDVKDTQRCLRRRFQTRYQLMVPNAVWYDNELDLACFRMSGFLDEFEIKMSRSDFKADFKKTSRYMEKGSDAPTWKKKGGLKHDLLISGDAIANHFYFVLRDGIASAEEIPEEYGVIWIRDGGWLQVEREATRLHSRKLTLETQLRFAMKLNFRWWDNFLAEGKPLKDRLYGRG